MLFQSLSRVVSAKSYYPLAFDFVLNFMFELVVFVEYFLAPSLICMQFLLLYFDSVLVTTPSYLLIVLHANIPT